MAYYTFTYGIAILMSIYTRHLHCRKEDRVSGCAVAALSPQPPAAHTNCRLRWCDRSVLVGRAFAVSLKFSCCGRFRDVGCFHCLLKKGNIEKTNESVF